MALTTETQPEHLHSSIAATARQYTRLKARAERWARLCRDLSTHAAELRNLRDELMPGANDVALREAQLETRRKELELREAEVARRWKALEGGVRELVRQRKQLTACQHELENSRQQAYDQHLLKAAELELQAERRFAEAEALSEELDACDSELRGAARQLEVELQELDADPAESPAASCTS